MIILRKQKEYSLKSLKEGLKFGVPAGLLAGSTIGLMTEDLKIGIICAAIAAGAATIYGYKVDKEMEDIMKDYTTPLSRKIQKMKSINSKKGKELIRKFSSKFPELDGVVRILKEVPRPEWMDEKHPIFELRLGEIQDTDFVSVIKLEEDGDFYVGINPERGNWVYLTPTKEEKISNLKTFLLNYYTSTLNSWQLAISGGDEGAGEVGNYLEKLIASIKKNIR